MFIFQAGDDSEAYLRYGQALASAGSYEEPLRKAISLDANNLEAYTQLAKALSAKGATEEACRTTQQAAKLEKTQ